MYEDFEGKNCLIFDTGRLLAFIKWANIHEQQHLECTTIATLVVQKMKRSQLPLSLVFAYWFRSRVEDIAASDRVKFMSGAFNDAVVEQNLTVKLQLPHHSILNSTIMTAWYEDKTLFIEKINYTFAEEPDMFFWARHKETIFETLESRKRDWNIWRKESFCLTIVQNLWKFQLVPHIKLWGNGSCVCTKT